MRGRGTLSVNTSESPQSVQDQIDVLARRHVTFVFNDTQAKTDKGLLISSAPDSATGKFIVAINPSVPSELRRAFGKDVHAEGLIKRDFGMVMAHLDDYMENSAGLNSKDLLKILRAAEAKRLSARQTANHG